MVFMLICAYLFIGMLMGCICYHTQKRSCGCFRRSCYYNKKHRYLATGFAIAWPPSLLVLIFSQLVIYIMTWSERAEKKAAEKKARADEAKKAKELEMKQAVDILREAGLNVDTSTFSEMS